MKLPIIAGAMLLAVVAEGAMAACPGASPSQVKGTDLAPLLSGKTLCSGTTGINLWQEEHHGSGTVESELWDYKTGDVNDPVDPRKQIGTWEVTVQGANTVVTYKYGTPNPQYSFKVFDDGGSYSFCDAAGPSTADKVGVILVNGFGGCSIAP